MIVGRFQLLRYISIFAIHYKGEKVWKKKEARKKSPKLLMILVLTALVVVGGSVSAFLLVNKSPKIKYFLAEAETFKQMGDLVEDRYKNELKWIDVQQDKPVETKFDLSGEWNDSSDDNGMQGRLSFVNSVTLSMKQVNDPVKKEMEVALSGKLGSVDVKFGSLFATTDKLLASLPFMDELIRFDDKDFGKLMKETDPDYEGNERLGLSSLFENRFAMTEELRTYVEKEYIEYFIKELPEKAFTSDKEEIVVFNKKINAKRVKMKLSEEEVKTLLKDLFLKAKTDKKLKSILEEQVALSSIAGDVSSNEIATMMEDYEEGLDEVIKGIDSISIPNGLQSTIWHQSNTIVKREFTMGMGTDKNNVSKLVIGGTQLLDNVAQKWDYTVGVKDPFGANNDVKIIGDLTWKNQKADDSITITMDDVKLTYKGKEDLKDKKRTFDRSFGFLDGDMNPALIWKGSATHESDSMKADHEFTFNQESIDDNTFNVILKQQGKVVKKVAMPKENADTVNIGQMKMDEIEAFIDENLAPKFQEWVTSLMGDIEGELDNL